MKSRPLQAKVDRIIAGLAPLSSRNKALFFLCCAERFHPMAERLQEISDWAGAAGVRAILDRLWHVLALDAAPVLNRELHRLEEEYTPHSDDFPLIECGFAQCVTTCGAASIRFLCEDASVSAEWLEVVYDALKGHVCDEQTGFVDLGDDPATEAFEASVANDPRLLREMACQNADLQDLACSAVASPDLVIRLRERAIAARWTTGKLR